MKTYSVAILPGDGIGPEVIGEARRVLEATGRLFGFRLTMAESLIGQAALDATGKLWAPETLQIARAAHAVLMGPVGGRRDEHPTSLNHPKQALSKLRAWLGTHTTLRPIKTYRALADCSPLKPEGQGFDLLVVHDHASGLPYGTPRSLELRGDELVATNTQIYSTTEIARVARIACRAAAERRGLVTSADQSKDLETGELWRDVAELVAAFTPGVTLTRMDADNLMFDMVRCPSRYDVVLANQAIGELVAMTAAGLTGSYAVHPAAYVGGTTGIFQPGHGAALDIAGRGTANPIAAIRAAAMLLNHGLHQDQEAAAQAIESAVEDVLNSGILSADMSASGRSTRTTREIGDAVIHALERRAPGAEFRAAMP
jgi:3-isopropylmalate dehydrogenase